MKTKKVEKKLTLNKITINTLVNEQLKSVNGGAASYQMSNCYQCTYVCDTDPCSRTHPIDEQNPDKPE